MKCRIGDPLDNLIYFNGEFEPELQVLLTKLAPGLTTVVDVGCNIGYVSCLLAALTRSRARVISIDANPEMVRRCEENLQLNGFPAEAISCAVGRAEEVRTFHVPLNRPSYASFGELNHACNSVDVPVRRLENFVAEKGLMQIDLLKIDVEGFEPEVLAGVGDVPIRNICLEFSPENLKNCGFAPDDLWRLPLWKKYRLFQLEAGTGNAIPFQPGSSQPEGTETFWAEALDN